MLAATGFSAQLVSHHAPYLIFLFLSIFKNSPTCDCLVLPLNKKHIGRITAWAVQDLGGDQFTGLRKGTASQSKANKQHNKGEETPTRTNLKSISAGKIDWEPRERLCFKTNDIPKGL